MLLPAEQVYAGIWQGPLPDELVDFELCRALGWSWADLDQTPEYVRKVFWHLLLIRQEQQAKAAEEAAEEAKPR